MSSSFPVVEKEFSPPERLIFCLELFISSVTSLKYSCPNPLISFRLSDFPAQFIPSRSSNGAAIDFQRGKSCLFQLADEEFQSLLNNSPLQILLLSAEQGHYSSSSSSQAKFVGSCFVDLSAFRSEILLPTRNSTRGYRRGNFALTDMMGNNVAAVTAIVRLSCLGGALAPHLRLIKQETQRAAKPPQPQIHPAPLKSLERPKVQLSEPLQQIPRPQPPVEYPPEVPVQNVPFSAASSAVAAAMANSSLSSVQAALAAVEARVLPPRVPEPGLTAIAVHPAVAHRSAPSLTGSEIPERSLNWDALIAQELKGYQMPLKAYTTDLYQPPALFYFNDPVQSGSAAAPPVEYHSVIQAEPVWVGRTAGLETGRSQTEVEKPHETPAKRQTVVDREISERFISPSKAYSASLQESFAPAASQSIKPSYPRTPIAPARHQKSEKQTKKNPVVAQRPATAAPQKPLKSSMKAPAAKPLANAKAAPATARPSSAAPRRNSGRSAVVAPPPMPAPLDSLPPSYPIPISTPIDSSSDYGLDPSLSSSSSFPSLSHGKYENFLAQVESSLKTREELLAQHRAQKLGEKLGEILAGHKASEPEALKAAGPIRNLKNVYQRTLGVDTKTQPPPVESRDFPLSSHLAALAYENNLPPLAHRPPSSIVSDLHEELDDLMNSHHRESQRPSGNRMARIEQLQRQTARELDYQQTIDNHQ